MQIPERKSWWYYTWRYLAIVSAFFIWFAIDSFDIPEQMFPDWEPPSWAGHNIHVRAVPLIVLLASMVTGTIVIYWLVRMENNRLRSTIDEATQDESGRKLSTLQKLQSRGKSIEAAAPEHSTHEQNIPAWKGRLIEWQSEVSSEIEDPDVAQRFTNPPEPSAEEIQVCKRSRFTEIKCCLIVLSQQLNVLDEIITSLKSSD